MVPTNPDDLEPFVAFKESLRLIGQVFSSKSVFRLVYNLQIIEYLVGPVSADDDNNFVKV